ncbi:MAG: class I SAM-dependent methyltransferase [Nakamurella sp.]
MTTKKTDELRAAHDALADFYAGRLTDSIRHMPIERAVFDLFCELTRAANVGDEVGDIGCGVGHLEPLLAEWGLAPRGVDLSPKSIRLAQRDYPGFRYEVADLRALPFEDESLAGIVCWYSLIYLSPHDRPAALRELFRVVKPGGYFLTGFKAGDDQVRRGGRTANLGVEFDVYWLSPAEEELRVAAAGFSSVFWGGRPPEGAEGPGQAFLLSRKPPV